MLYLEQTVGTGEDGVFGVAGAPSGGATSVLYYMLTFPSPADILLTGAYSERL